jgi:hypothetical protein
MTLKPTAPGPYLVTLNPFGAVPHATSYAAQLCDSAGVHCQSAISATTAGFNFTGLAAGTTYTVTLTAVGDGTAYANSPAAARSGTAWWSCLVVDATTSEPAANTLQATVDTAQPGDTLKVYGTCNGNATINKNLNLAGQNDPAFGAPMLAGDGTDSVVKIGLTSAPTITITGLTITGGNASPTTTGEGGGIYLQAGTLTLDRSVVRANQADFEGGGIFNRGTLTITNSAVSGNSSSTHGGGIGSAGALTIINSSITGNTDGELGGGILAGGPTTTITNSTITGNTAHVGGGLVAGSTTTITNSTITHNTAENSPGTGGGISGSPTLVNTIVADNFPDNIN